MKTGENFRNIFTVIATTLVVLMSTLATGASGELEGIRWKTPSAPSAKTAIAAPSAVLSQGAERHVVMQFAGPARPGLRAELAAQGIVLLKYLGSNAYFVKVPGAAKAAGAAAKVAAAGEIDLRWKLHPKIASGDWPSWSVFPVPAASNGTEAKASPEEVEMAALYVMFHPDVDLGVDAVAALERHGGIVRDMMATANALVAWVPKANVEALAAEDAVEWVEPPLPPFEALNDSNRALTQADQVQNAPYKLDGKGVTALVFDDGTARETHVDFGGRLHVRDGSGMEDHPTHVAGSLGGDGTASGGKFHGMAPRVTIQSYGFEEDGTGVFLYTNPGDLEHDYDEAINTYGAEIATNSIGTNTAHNGFPCSYEGDYGVTDTLIDSIVCGALGAPMRIVWANGNERFDGGCGNRYHTTAPPACAKNHITVGAVNSNDDSMTDFSSWGPADDGRIKPDVCGPGCQSNDDKGVTSCVATSDTAYASHCGTSMATPTVAGLCALILQDYKAQFPGKPLPRNSTMKTLLAHNAVDLGNMGPDYQFGYGSVRVKDTIDFMRQKSFLEESIDQGQERVYIVPVAPGTASLKATIAWDDPPGAVNTSPELVNDLDVVLVEPDGATVHYPWTLDPNNPDAPAVRTQPDHCNNIEQVVVDAPVAGAWTIRVKGDFVAQGPQVYSLATSPFMQSCTHAGLLVFDRTSYGCSSVFPIMLNDCDLDANPNAVETVNVTVASTSQPTPQTVTLTESGVSTSVFTGSVQLSPTNAPGALLVSDGDTLTATYMDADDGAGHLDRPTIATSLVDCAGPVVSDLVLTDLGRRGVTVSFTTDELAFVQVQYGLHCGGPYTTISQAGRPTLDHSLVIRGLTPDTPYFFKISATDILGNTTVDDNAGGCHSFRTLLRFRLPFADDFETGHLDKWEVNYGASGNTPVVSDKTSLVGDLLPHGGEHVAFLGDSTDNVIAEATMDVLLDLSSLASATLSFWCVGYQLEDDNWLQIDIFDGVWHKKVRTVNLPAWQQVVLDLSPYNLTNDFIVRFHSVANYAETTDATYIDDVSITGNVNDVLRISPRGGGADFTSVGSAGGPFTPASKTYTLSNTGSAAFNWSAAVTQPWVAVSPTTGTIAPGDTATVTVSPSAAANALAPGVYTDKVAFTNLSNAYSDTRNITLTVTESLTATPSTGVAASGKAGGPFAPNSATYTLSNAGGVDLPWTAASSQPWMSVSPSGGTILPGQTATVQISINAAANTLMPGAYDSTITFANVATGERITRAVALTVGEPMTLGPISGLTAWGHYGGPFAPSSKDFTLANTGSVALPWTAGSSHPWVDVSPSGGTLPAGATTTVAVSLNSAAASLGVGAYSSDITFRNTATGYNPVRIVAVGVTEPITVTPSSDFTSSGVQGTLFTPNSAAYTVTNTSSVDVAWSAALLQTWADVSPSSGTLHAGESAPVTVTLNYLARSLTPGFYSNRVTVNDTTSGGSVSRGIALTVLQPRGTLSVSDSIPPADDLSMHFGSGIIGSTAMTQHVTVTNTHPIYDLTIRDVRLGSLPIEDFQSGELTAYSSKNGFTSYVTSAAGAHDGTFGLDGSSSGWLYRDDAAVHVAQGDTLTCWIREAGTSAGFISVGFGANDIGTYALTASFSTGELFLQRCDSYFSSTRLNSVSQTFDLNKWYRVEIAWGLGGAMTGSLYDTDGTTLLNSVSAADTAYLYGGIAFTGSPRFQVDTIVRNGPVWSPFRLLNAPLMPVTLPAGESFTADVVFNPSKLGSFTDHVVVESNDLQNPTSTVLLTASVTQDPLEVSPAGTLAATGLPGGPFTPNSIDYTLKNAGSVSIPWTAAGPAWVDISPSGGTLAPGATTTVHVALNSMTNAFTPSVSNGAVTFTDGSTGVLTARAVSLTVLAPISLSPATGFYSAGTIGGPFSHSPTVYTLANAGATSLPWTATATQPWIEVAPSSGTLAPRSSTSVAVSIGAAARAFMPGSYSGSVTLSSTDAHFTTSRSIGLRISESLTVAPRGGVEFSGPQRGPFTPTSGSYTLTNMGGVDLPWTATVRERWLDVNPPSGSIRPGETAVVTLTLNSYIDVLGPNVYSDEVTFTNTFSGYKTTRDVALRVQVHPGTVSISDSIAPPYDLKLPFGVVPMGSSPVTQHVRVENSDLLYDLTLTGFHLDANTVEGFENGTLAAYTTQNGTAAFTLTETAAHDGSFGLNGSSTGWLCRDDASVHIGPGDTISCWMRPSSFEGDFAFGFGANAAGTYSVKVSLSSSRLLLERNDLYAGSVSLAEAPQGWMPEQWLRMEVQWALSGLLTVRLYDTDGITLLNTLSAIDTTYSGGGIAFHSSINTQFDTITRRGPAATEPFELVNIPDMPKDLSSGEAFTADVIFHPDTPGNYTRFLFVESNDSHTPAVQIQLTATSLADSLTLEPAGGLVALGPQGGPFAPPSATYTLSNRGAGQIHWTATTAVAWLDLSNAGGSLDATKQATVTVSLNAAANALANGVYNASVVFKNTDSGYQCTRDVKLTVGTIRVDGRNTSGIEDGLSWATAFSTIQRGIDAASVTGGEVWVAGGTYTGTVTLANSVHVYGGFAGTETARNQRDFKANLTTIDATTASSRYHVVTINAVTNTRIDGFHITGGNANGSIVPNNSGAGVWCVNLDDTNTIANCTIVNNVAAGRGGGVSCYPNAVPRIEGCLIAGNTAGYGGGIFCDGCKPAISGCTIGENAASVNGGGILCQVYASPWITNCSISGNQASNHGGGLHCEADSSPTVTNCTFDMNESSGLSGGGMSAANASNPTLTNCIFTRNAGAAIHESSTDSDPVVRSCLFNANVGADYYDENATGLTGAAAINALPGNSANLDGPATYAQDAGAAIIGTWTAAPAYDAATNRTTLTDARAHFVPGALADRLVRADANTNRLALVVSNTATQIVVLGDVTGYVQSADAYQFADLRLTAGSSAIDTGSGTGAPSVDILGNARPVDIPAQGANATGTEFDIGAYECGDGTPPNGSITIDGGAAFTSTTVVTLALAATDTGSGVAHMRLSNSETWDSAYWEPYATSKSWTLTSGDGVKTLRAQFADNAGNASLVVSASITLDTTAPVATLASTALDPADLPIPVDVTLSEPSPDFGLASISAVNATVGSLTGDGTHFSFVLTPIAQGYCSCIVPVAAFTDRTGHPNTEPSNKIERVYDTISPRPVMTSTAPEHTTQAPVPVKVKFNKPVTGFTADDIQATNASVANFAGADADYTFDLAPSGQGRVSAAIAAGICADTDGHPNLIAIPLSRTYDTVSPTASIVLVTQSPSSADTVVFHVTFNEPVGSSFTASDISLTPGSLGGTLQVSGTDPDYTVTIPLANPDTDGAVGITLGTGVTDLAGNSYAGGLSPSAGIYNWRGFQTQPSGTVKAYIGGTYTFHVQPNCGASAFTYQWWFNDGTSPISLPGADAADLTLDSVTADNAGAYWCKIPYDGIEQTSDAATLVLAEHLQIEFQPEGANKSAGGSHTFSVDVTGGFLPLSYQWKKDGETIPGASNETFVLDPLTESDTGTYVVDVSDAFNDAVTSAPADLSVGVGVPTEDAAGLALLVFLLAWSAARRLTPRRDSRRM